MDEVLPAGSTILCNACRKPLYTTTVPLHFGQRSRPEQFAPISDTIPQPATGDRTICALCGGQYLVLSPYGVRLRTPDGVFPPHGEVELDA